MTAGKDVIEFRGSRKKYLTLSLCIAATGALCLTQRDFPPMIVIAGFAGVLALVCAWAAINPGIVLVLDTNGFEITHLGEKKRYTWAETSEFTADGYAVYFAQKGTAGQMMLMLHDASAEEVLGALLLHKGKYGAEPAVSGEHS